MVAKNSKRQKKWTASDGVNPQVAARVAPELVARLDAVAKGLTASRAADGVTFDRGAIVRMCILRALPALEVEAASAPSPTKTPTKKRAAASKTAGAE